MDIRQKFEQWAVKSNPDYETPEVLLDRNPAGDYAMTRIQGAWEGYQAALTQAQEPIAHLKFWAAQNWSGSGNHDIEYAEGLCVCEAGDIGDDKLPAFPVFAAPVRSSTQLTEEQVVCALGCIVIGRDMGHISTENAKIVREFIRASEVQAQEPVGAGDGGTFIVRDQSYPKSAAPAKSLAVSDGWMLVPIESTDEMLVAPGSLRKGGKVERMLRDVWMHMLAASPVAPKAQENPIAEREKFEKHFGSKNGFTWRNYDGT